MEIAQILQNEVAFIGLVGLLTSWIKARLNLSGNRTVLVSFLVAAVLFFLGLLAQQSDQINTYVNMILGIVMSAAAAGGGVDLTKGILSSLPRSEPQAQLASFSPAIIENVMSSVWDSEVGEFVKELIKSNPVLSMFTGSYTMLEPFVTLLANQVLTEDVKDALRLQVQTLARQVQLIQSTNQASEVLS